MEGSILYPIDTSATNITRYYNLVRDLSFKNSKGLDHTSSKGVPLVYTCDIRITCEGAGSFYAWTAPETWKVRNAGVKWHALRHQMFRDAGISKKEMGRYAQTIRPYFSKCHKLALAPGDISPSGPTPNPAYGVVTNGDGDCAPLVPAQIKDNMLDWDYSVIAVTPPIDESSVIDMAEGGLVDTFDLSVLGDHDITAATATSPEKWANVGMVKSYLEDREGVDLVAGAGVNLDSRITPGNPLAMLTALSTAANEITEIADDQQYQQPPYQTGQPSMGFTAYQADFSGAASTGPSGNTSFTPTVTLFNVRIPWGILAMRDETTLAQSVLVDIKVKRIEEMA